MRVNPGGQIDPSEVVGRDLLIRRLWRILERQSLILSSERRIGKTTIIKKMRAEAPSDFLHTYHELEAIITPLEFVEAVFNDVDQYLSKFRRTAVNTHKLLAQLTGIEIAGVFKFPAVVAPHWKALLTKVVQDLVTQQDRQLILFWDEIPIMLDNIKKRSGEHVAMEVLDTLRSLRQMYPTLRMVLTGSIGLHHVISSLRSVGYANDPTNDMYLVNVPPLTTVDAQELALHLLNGERIKSNDLAATAEAIAREVDGIPFFIHHVIDQIREEGEIADVRIVKEIVASNLTNSQDAWHLYHYRQRMDNYYTEMERPLALAALDVLAVDSPLSFEDLFNRVKSRLVTDDSEFMRYVLMLLLRDHYIVQSSDGSFTFRFSLIKRWWRLSRGLKT